MNYINQFFKDISVFQDVCSLWNHKGRYRFPCACLSTTPWTCIGECKVVSHKEITPSTYPIQCWVDSKTSVHTLEKKEKITLNQCVNWALPAMITNGKQKLWRFSTEPAELKEISIQSTNLEIIWIHASCSSFSNGLH